MKRSGAVSFTIGSTAYAGLGMNGNDSLGAFKDFYAYTASSNSWTQVARFPGKGRYLAVAFSDANFGYVGTGYDGLNYLSDFWKYDPTKNTWTQIASFPSARYGAVAFTVKNVGYVGTGNTGNTQNDFYQYNATANTWSAINGFPGAKRQGASAFTVNDKGYVMLGTDNAAYPTDVYSYDPGTSTWTARRQLMVHSATSADALDYDYSLLPRANAVSFAVGSMGYIATGTKGTVQGDCWAYNPADDTWTLKTAFNATTTGGGGGVGRSNGIGFAIGTTGYVGLGVTGTTRLDDLYQFAPDAVPQ
ncbi:hypothetical protein AXW84_06880 [Hymenobacter sp. PAMC 26628]|nr:hypothetical protein AXW84_06880 [Hymenobacter sp. PAMC 26628]